jgi:hypothetical protein
MSGVIVYISSVSADLAVRAPNQPATQRTTQLTHGCPQLKKAQQHIMLVLDGKKIPYTAIDVALDPAARTRMRELL